jgi:hypothetical protein
VRQHDQVKENISWICPYTVSINVFSSPLLWSSQIKKWEYLVLFLLFSPIFYWWHDVFYINQNQMSNSWIVCVCFFFFFAELFKDVILKNQVRVFDRTNFYVECFFFPFIWVNFLAYLLTYPKKSVFIKLWQAIVN